MAAVTSSLSLSLPPPRCKLTYPQTSVFVCVHTRLHPAPPRHTCLRRFPPPPPRASAVWRCACSILAPSWPRTVNLQRSIDGSNTDKKEHPHSAQTHRRSIHTPSHGSVVEHRVHTSLTIKEGRGGAIIRGAGRFVFISVQSFFVFLPSSPSLSLCFKSNGSEAASVCRF